LSAQISAICGKKFVVMKIRLEEVKPDADSSFRILQPRLNHLFYWHFHPEYEIVFIEGANGTRHVGDHLAKFEGSDLVFIGPNIPHLNFDYGIRTPYEKIVIQMKEDFLIKAFLNIPELTAIHHLFEKARHGISFYGETKRTIGERLKSIVELDHFHQLLEVLAVFQIMANSGEVTLLNAQPVDQHYNLKEQQRIRKVHHFVEEHYQRKIAIKEMADLTHLTPPAFCRYFKKMTLLTFTEFLNQYRIGQAKKLLLMDKNVTETCFESGFESLSYFNRIFRKVTGGNPLQFKKEFRNQEQVVS
jgi:AraC-like DNA-binding protein